MALATTSVASPAAPPAVESGWLRWRAAYYYWWCNYRRTWRGTAISSVAGPVFYLAAMGVGLGSLVDHHGHGAGRLGDVSYLVFVAPGLVAATAMQIASFEATWPVLGSIKWMRGYHAMLAGPLTVQDVLAGHLAWVATRVASSVAVYLAVVAAFGAIGSWWAVLVWPAATLVGLAFAAPIMAFAATVENENGFAVLYRFVVIPLFLFSGAFFPVSQLPQVLRVVAYLTPLWHGVSLCRDLALGHPQVLPSALHVGYLLAWVIVGTVLARRCFRRRLLR